jgi:hypothetical protein
MNLGVPMHPDQTANLHGARLQGMLANRIERELQIGEWTDCAIYVDTKSTGNAVLDKITTDTFERWQVQTGNSRSHDAVIRVYDEAGKVIEAHEPEGDSSCGEVACACRSGG